MLPSPLKSFRPISFSFGEGGRAACRTGRDEVLGLGSHLLLIPSDTPREIHQQADDEEADEETASR